MECMENAQRILSENKIILQTLAEELIEKEALSGEEIDSIIDSVATNPAAT